MIDYIKGTYGFADSLSVPMFGQQPTFGECECLVDEEAQQTAETEMSKNEEFERELLLRRLGSAPTDYPRAIGAADFAGMLEDLKNASTTEAKVRTLHTWAAFFHGTLHEEMLALASALEAGDESAVRRLVARICA